MIYHLNLEILQIKNIHHLSVILDIIVILYLKKIKGEKMVRHSIVKNRKKMKNHKSSRYVFEMVVGIQINNFSNPQVLKSHRHADIKI